jgi:transcriptional regulator with XRE-family HTH domain
MAGAGYEGLNGRIKELRTALKLSQRQFAKRIFVSQTLVNEIEAERYKVNLRIIHLIASQLNVNIDWLKRGTGDMFMETPQDARLEHIIDIFHRLDRPLQNYLLAQSKELLKVQTEMAESTRQAAQR